MFIIFQPNLNKYFTTKEGTVIVFNSDAKACNFANAFYNNFALPHAMELAFTDPSIVGMVINSAQNWEIESLPEKYEYEIINFEELKRR